MDLKTDNERMKERILSDLAASPSPYDQLAGGVFLDRAWRRGAEFAVHKYFESMERAARVGRSGESGRSEGPGSQQPA